MRELGIGPLLASTLVTRGYTDPEEAARFLDPQLDRLHPADLLPDYDQAVSAILGAKERGETIFVHGDYDVDGVTSAALFTRFLEKVGCQVVPHVPHRMKEGYGIHMDMVQVAKEKGAKLFLTCDCGSGAHSQIEAANEAGMTVVVTDHHLIDEAMPRAAAIVNPHRADSLYPFRDLSGVGVVFKVCEGVAKALGLPVHQYRRAYIDLAALGTVADVMPLVGENRILVRHGLAQVQTTKKVGLQALMDVTKFDRNEPGAELRAHHVGFQLGPRLNAAGRIDDASLALELLLESDHVRAKEIASKLDELNRQRRQEQDEMFQAAVDEVVERELDRNLVLVVAKEGWHPGIVGIVAGKLVERFSRPAFVLNRNPEKGIVHGSGRSIAGFHLGRAIDRVEPLGARGGGHAMAAGFSVREESLDEVVEALNAFASEFLTHEDLLPSIEITAEVAPTEVDRKSIEELEALEPLGFANPRPVYVVRGARLGSATLTKGGEHLMMTFEVDGRTQKAIAFGFGDAMDDLDPGMTLDVVIEPKIEEFNGSRFAKWYVRDFRPSHP